LKARWLNENAMQLDYVRSEIERMRTQVHRQRGEIRQLQRAGGSPQPRQKRSWSECSTRSMSFVPNGTAQKVSLGQPKAKS
jgi:hypothetical protein